MRHPDDDYSPFDHLGDYQDKPEFMDDIENLQKEISKLKRWEKKLKQTHELDISYLRDQIQQLLAKNFDLTEANNIFARGLEQLKQENRIITQSHLHHVIDAEGIKKKIEELTAPPTFGPDLKRRIVSMIVLEANSRNQATKVLIVTEHIEKPKRTKED